MRTRHVRQAITSDCLFNVLATWCRAGAGQRSESLKILSAFASGLGVTAISPLLDIFLADGNSVSIVFGADRNGTDRSAVERLYALRRAHHDQMSVAVFAAPSRGAIFHPKLYIYDQGRGLDFVIGSANLTTGGLASNFESLLLYEAVSKSSRLAREVMGIWNLFARPGPPLSAQFLRQLSARYAAALIRRLPVRTPQETSGERDRVRNLWRPLSRISLPRSRRLEEREPLKIRAISKRYLVMDVLRETRRTQMQIPLAIATEFFAVGRTQRATLSISILTEDGLTQPIDRPLVMSGLGFGRLMRRLEVPPIRTMERPLIIVLLRLDGRRRFAYTLVERASRDYRVANALLRAGGQQGKGIRRYIVGDVGDQTWRKVAKLLPRRAGGEP